ncbi:hypothetical protein BT96DRAFT_998569 [Gymnopus androsaceus JB14]|uniref:Uncharacterized protein n=1 Tax=Gymnopus androsaceus JB14 TaxID=1447944 RepID=A0A6A4H989_9AGAR|nr:hypothetical protein BT96DRAFT_998569 [Gymnopus androsaceus JB14]
MVKIAHRKETSTHTFSNDVWTPPFLQIPKVCFLCIQIPEGSYQRTISTNGNMTKEQSHQRRHIVYRTSRRYRAIDSRKPSLGFALYQLALQESQEEQRMARDYQPKLSDNEKRQFSKHCLFLTRAIYMSSIEPRSRIVSGSETESPRDAGQSYFHHTSPGSPVVSNPLMEAELWKPRPEPLVSNTIIEGISATPGGYVQKWYKRYADRRDDGKALYRAEGCNGLWTCSDP